MDFFLGGGVMIVCSFSLVELLSISLFEIFFVIEGILELVTCKLEAL